MVEAEVGGTFASTRVNVSTGFGFPLSQPFDDWDVDATVRVGITDRIQFEAGTAFSIDHTARGRDFEGTLETLDARPSLASWDHMIPVRLSVLALDTETLDAAVTLTLPFVAYEQRVFRLFRGGEIIVRNSNGRALPQVDLAAPTRWRLTDWLWLRAGQDLFAIATADGTARFAFDFGIGVQPHPMLAVTLDSRIASITFNGEGHQSSRTVADVGTMAIEATFTPIRWLDFVGDLDIPNVGNGLDVYALRTAVRVRF